MNKGVKKPCRQCGIPYYVEGLIGGDICYRCMREPAEIRPMTVFEKLMAFGVAAFLLVALGLFLFGCAPESEPQPAQFRVITGYHDYQQFTERN